MKGTVYQYQREARREALEALKRAKELEQLRKKQDNERLTKRSAKSI